VNVPAKNFLYQKLISTQENLDRNIRIMMSRLEYLANKNKLPLSGDPFVIYQSEDKDKNTVTFLVGIPVADEIFVAPDSDVAFSKLTGYRAVKTLLIGDYSHLNHARSSTLSYISK